MFQVWKGRTQVQRLSPLERRKGVASSGKGSACGQATKGTAKRIEEKSGACPMIEDTGAL